MGNGIFANCCRHVTDLIFQTRSFRSTDERSPLLAKSPAGCTAPPDVSEPCKYAKPYPDVILSNASDKRLQKQAEYVYDLPEEGREEVTGACVNSCLEFRVATAGLLQQAQASCALAVLPVDLERESKTLLNHARLLEACQGCVKLEDGGLDCKTRNQEEHVVPADKTDASPGMPVVWQQNQDFFKREEALNFKPLDKPGVPLDCRAAGPYLGSYDTTGSSECNASGKMEEVQKAQQAVLSSLLQDESAHLTHVTSACCLSTDPAACAAGELSCSLYSKGNILPSKQKKRKRKKKFPFLGAHGAMVYSTEYSLRILCP